MGLLKLAEKLGNVTESCKVMGYSRDGFYRFQKLYEEGGELALKEISLSKPLLKNHIPEEDEKAVVMHATQPSNFGKTYATYGGIFIVMALLWAWKIDGFKPDKYDELGAFLALVGVGIHMYFPRN